MSIENKKVIRLTESEMVDLIEKIVNEVKTTKRKAIKESRQPKKVSRKPVSRRK